MIISFQSRSQIGKVIYFISRIFLTDVNWEKTKSSKEKRYKTKLTSMNLEPGAIKWGSFLTMILFMDINNYLYLNII